MHKASNFGLAHSPLRVFHWRGLKFKSCARTLISSMNARPLEALPEPEPLDVVWMAGLPSLERPLRIAKNTRETKRGEHKGAIMNDSRHPPAVAAAKNERERRFWERRKRAIGDDANEEESGGGGGGESPTTKLASPRRDSVVVDDVPPLPWRAV
ncbi:hypothetical protein QR680_010311 [Steinernema hermaphroditum]|uniref:Uncharacterized protein n=2 Tax=Steinernema hermaphroditum TaxID=289476 RepID=A0AA39IQ57_9BILA|nr:hypothetical protein QR680_010311 [Steinernema hermaphroditum]